MILLILFEKPHKHAKTNKFVFVLTFGEANIEIDIYIYIYLLILALQTKILDFIPRDRG